jgi:hypothetical protein
MKLGCKCEACIAGRYWVLVFLALIGGALGGAFGHYVYGLVAMVLRHCGGL